MVTSISRPLLRFLIFAFEPIGRLLWAALKPGVCIFCVAFPVCVLGGLDWAKTAAAAKIMMIKSRFFFMKHLLMDYYRKVTPQVFGVWYGYASISTSPS
jgi:hypothetical protein